uniref:Envelope glycoprotein gp160 n=1 Tax=Simian immunodeficiency virus TaxID=11723 RepID=Q70IG7_SIV|nr:envelope glycoprotein precursor gp160 [Simian immunodeficiency virus]
MSQVRRTLKVLLLILWTIGIICTTEKQYVTVFYGIPAWRNSAAPLFCTAMDRGVWAAASCVPEDPYQREVWMENATDYFDIYHNPIVDQVVQNMKDLYKQTFKPCVKLTPVCVRMNCTRKEDNSTNAVTVSSTTTTTTTIKTPTTEWYGGNKTTIFLKCNFNMTTGKGFRDKRVMYEAHCRIEDVMEDRETNQTYYYMRYCNQSTITQACEKVVFEPFKIRMCAPAGFALLKCNDHPWSGYGLCKNMSARVCTDEIHTMASTWLIMNSTVELLDNHTQIIRNTSKDNQTIAILFRKSSVIKLKCTRPGNVTLKGLNMAAGIVMRATIIPRRAIRRAACKIVGGNWTRTRQEIEKAVKEEFNINGTVKWDVPRVGGDPETSSARFQCRGEFFYCNLTRMFNSSQYPVNNSNIINNQTYMVCNIKQLVNTWHTVGMDIYLPPAEGEITCTSNVSGIIVDTDVHPNRTHITLTLSADVRQVWRAELARWKLVELTPIGLAPTSVRRYEGPESAESVSRRRREVSLVLGLIGFLSAAGTVMGAVGTGLAVQSRDLLAGIVQQQQELLRAVEGHSALLQLSVWGIKNLNARLTAIEKYLKDQALLNEWGCAWKQICHTSVEWSNQSIPGLALYQPDFQNMTWQQWETDIAALFGNVSDALKKAQAQQERNVHEVQSLYDWDNLWNWFDLSKWFWWIRLVVYVIAGLVILRIIMFIINVLSRLCRGYSPLLQIPIRPQKAANQPEEGEGESGDGNRLKWWQYPRGFLSIIWEDLSQLLTWSYLTLRNLVFLIRTACSRIWDFVHRHSLILLGYFQYGLQELQTGLRDLGTSAIQQGRATAEVVLAALTRAAREVVAIPRRIRQGLEIVLN